MKDYFFFLFKKSDYSLDYLDSLSEDELKDCFYNQTWDDEQGDFKNTDICFLVPFDEFCGRCNDGSLVPTDFWLFLVGV